MMTTKQLWDEGLLSSRSVIQAALREAGFTHGDANEIVEDFESGIKKPADRQPYRPWRQEDDQALNDACEEAGHVVPSSAAIRKVASELGRTPKSCLSRIERLGWPTAKPRKKEG